MSNLGIAEILIILGVLLVLSLGAAGIIIYFMMRSAKQKQNPTYPQSPTILCSQCGLSLPANSEYCNRCGKAVTKA